MKKKISILYKEKKSPVIYLGISFLCLITFIIYNQFSHGVTSPFMTFLFCWPLILGFIPYLLLAVIPKAEYPDRLTLNVYNSGVAALTVSSLLKGIFDIAGNASIYQHYLMIFGTIMLIAGIIIYIRQVYLSRKNQII